MAILGLLLITLAKLVKMLIDFYSLIVLAAVVMSWFRPNPYNPVVKVVYQLTAPVFNVIRRKLPPAFFRTGLDLTPLFVFMALIFLDSFVVGSLAEIGQSLRIKSYMRAPAEKSAPANLDDLPEL